MERLARMVANRYPPCLLRALCVLCGYFLFLTTRGSAAEVVPLEGAPFNGELVSIDAAGRATFRVTEAGGTVAEATAPSAVKTNSNTRVMHVDDLVRWGHPAPLRPQTLV